MVMPGTHKTSSLLPVRLGNDSAGRVLQRGFIVLLLWAMTTPWLLMVLGLSLVGASLALSVYTEAWHWFQRSGALLVSVGAMLSTQRPLRILLVSILGADTQRDERREISPSRQLEAGEIRTCVCGFLLVATGTLVWAYGDLIGCLLHWNASCLP